MGTLLFSSFSIGLLSSLHCAGMCGPLASALACGRPEARVSRVALFVAGKAAAYAALGLAAGLIGSALGGTLLGGRFFGVLSVGAGCFMIVLGARGLLRGGSARTGAAASPVDILMGHALKTSHGGACAAAGGLAALLPCGVVYAMIARSLVADTPARGALLMAAFGLGTAPSLFGVGLLSGLLAGKVRRWGERLAWGSVAVMGASALWRGFMMLLSASGKPACCH